MNVSGMSVEDELVLGLAQTARMRARGAPQLLELSQQANPERLMAALARQRIVQLGAERLRELGAGDIVAPVARELGERQRAMRWKGVEQEMLTHSIVGSLQDHGVASVTLKGAALARRLFDDPALRESDDIDLLVAVDQLEESVDLVRRQFGYDAPCDARDARGRPLLHHRLSHPGGLPMVELHWRVHWYEERSGAAMLERSVPEQGLRRLQPTDELACLLLVYARDGFTGVRGLADLAAWSDRVGDRLPPGGIDGFAREFPELRPALVIAGALAGALAGVPEPEVTVSGQPWTPRMRRAARLANWRIVGEDEQIYADIAMVDLLLTPPPQAWSSVRRQVLLPLDVVAGRLVEPGSSRSRRLLADAMHVPRIVARLALGLFATRGWRTRCPLPPVALLSGVHRR
jgi:Uncharacterised nucleotidyltransferase